MQSTAKLASAMKFILVVCSLVCWFPGFPPSRTHRSERTPVYNSRHKVAFSCFRRRQHVYWQHYQQHLCGAELRSEPIEPHSHFRRCYC